jgi:hypothetical protein
MSEQEELIINKIYENYKIGEWIEFSHIRNNVYTEEDINFFKSKYGKIINFYQKFSNEHWTYIADGKETKLKLINRKERIRKKSNRKERIRKKERD